MHRRNSMATSDLWTIVLAAGAGRRLAGVTGGVPKQFWHPNGAGASLLADTLVRVQAFAPPERTITVVDDSHRGYVRGLAGHWPLGEVLYQPGDRGTAAGVLLPLVTVLEPDPDAIVIVTPSDHGVEDTGVFRSGLKQAIGRVRNRTSELVLFGVEPTSPGADYGWITPLVSGRLANGAFQEVARFVEKPPAHEALQLFLSGAVWNTMVMVGRAAALLARYREHLPFMTDVLTRAAGLKAQTREMFLRDWYPELPSADFSRDVLTHSSPMSLYTWSSEIGWSDLGTPERLQEWLAIGRTSHGTDDPPRGRRAA